MLRTCLALSLLAIAVLGVHRARADTLDDIRHRGALTCAVSNDTDDFSLFDGHGNLAALGGDLCRAVAAAIFPDGRKPRIVVRGDEIAALRLVADGHADLMLGTSPDPALAASLHLAYAPPALIDGQGFLVDRREGITMLAQLAGKRVCFVDGTPAADTLGRRMDELGIAYQPFPFSERGEMISALASGHCNAATGDVSELANQRLALPALAAHFVVMRPMITIDAYAPALRDDEARLLLIATAVEDGLVSAAEHGVGQASAEADARHATDPIIRRLVGADPWMGAALGLDDLWLRRAIEAVGNQAEMYRRDAGAASPLALPVGANAPVSRGGALLSLPVEVPR